MTGGFPADRLERILDGIETAIESGASDRMNAVIDGLQNLDREGQIATFEACFDRCRELYDGTDGYGRQSIVRILDAVNPALGLMAVEMDAEGRHTDDVDRDRYREAVTRLQSFLLTTVPDSDGRVRRATIRTLKQVCVAYDVIDEQEKIEALVEDLERLRTDVEDEEVTAHIDEAIEQAIFHLRYPAGRIGTRSAEDFGDTK